MALMSGKVYSNTGAPSNADGNDGDIYLRLDGMKTTYRKESGAWVAVGSTLGAIPEIISGVGAPSSALGVDEQYYRDTGNQNIYYKQGSTWNLVGSLAAANLKAILDQAGIGKDLATVPNLINSGSLNAVTTVGEYYYNTAVADTPTPYGLMKVWRENSIAIYQLVQASGYAGKLYNRYTTDGGATWGPWVEYANVGGDSGQRFKVAAAVDPDDAVRLEQMKDSLELFQEDRTIFDTAGTHSFNLQPNKVVRCLLIAAGGGGGGIPNDEYLGAAGAATDGGASSIYPQGDSAGFFFKCNGGKAGGSPTTSNGGNPVYGSHGEAPEVELNRTYSAVILSYQDGLVMPNHFNSNTPTIRHPTIKALSLTHKGQGGRGGGSGYGLAGSGSGGSFVEGVIKNNSNTVLTLTIEIGVGGLGNSVDAGIGLNGENGLCVLFH